MAALSVSFAIIAVSVSFIIMAPSAVGWTAAGAQAAAAARTSKPRTRINVLNPYIVLLLV
jgi:hypothetical protein